MYQYINGDATFYGLDTHVAVGVTPEVTLNATGSYLYGQDDELDEPAIGVAPFQGSFGARYEDPMGRFYVEATETLVGPQTRVSQLEPQRSSDGRLPDARFASEAWALPNSITLRGGVLNVFDKYYYNHLNARNPFALPDRLPVPEPGRIFFVDVGVTF